MQTDLSHRSQGKAGNGLASSNAPAWKENMDERMICVVSGTAVPDARRIMLMKRFFSGEHLLCPEFP